MCIDSGIIPWVRTSNIGDEYRFATAGQSKIQTGTMPAISAWYTDQVSTT